MAKLWQRLWQRISKTYDTAKPLTFDAPKLGDGRPVKAVLEEHDVRIYQVNARLDRVVDVLGGEEGLERLRRLQHRKFDPIEQHDDNDKDKAP